MRHLVTFLAICATALLLGGDGMAMASPLDPHRKWVITQRLRDPGEGHGFQNFSDSVHSLGRYVVVGSTSANSYRGSCKVYHDAGDGLKLVATLTDPTGKLGDGFGHKVLLFVRTDIAHVAVSSIDKNGDGAVLIYRQGDTTADWVMQQELAPPNNDGTYATLFGRHVRFDGSAVIVSAESRYKHSKRYIISSTNVVGTRYFEESTGTEETAGDPIFVFATKDGRRNTTRLELLQTIRGADFTFDFGAGLDLSPDRQTLAVGAFSRREALFGYGTDGDLLVTGITLLDGTAEYNFNNVVVMPGGVLTTDHYEGIRGNGGILRMRIQGTLTVYAGGVINMSAHGFEGAPTKVEASALVHGEGPGGGITATSEFTGTSACNYADESTAILQGSAAVSNTKANLTSGLPFAEANGGGGGYGTPGEAGTLVQCGTSGTGGPTYGEQQVTTLYRGSGGGAGQPWKTAGSGGAGGDGGGAIWIAATRVINHGLIENNGGRGSDGGFYSGGGGGGSGGSIYITGIYFENYGRIHATGGFAGVRSTNSGSEGDRTVRGGDGGNGRIRLEFLTTLSSGEVIPFPLNGTRFDGDVYLYDKLSTGLYSLRTIVPRLPSMQFTGHSVALHDHILAVASDDRSQSNPQQSVYLLDLREMQNSSSPLYNTRILRPPRNTDRQFGWVMELYNDSLIIAAAGEVGISRGVLYLHTSRDLIASTERLKEFVSATSQVGDYYASAWHYDYSRLTVQVPVGQDDGFVDPSSRMSNGNIQVYRHLYNISASQSTVTCRYATATVNTSVLCTIGTRDAFGNAAGDVHDLALFSHPADITYVHTGRYEFTVTPQYTGVHTIYAEHNGVRLPTTTLTVTPAIIAHLGNFTCEPQRPIAGTEVVCTIQVFNDAGEESAAPYFRATVYHTDDVSLQAVPDAELTSHGNFRTPPSELIVAEALNTDFPTVLPDVEFVRFGVYSFRFKTWRPGPFAAFAQYRNAPLAFPNPLVVEALEPVLDPTESRVICPEIAAVNRTLVCTLHLNSADGIPTNREDLAANFSTSRYIQASIGGADLDFSTVWAREGRVSLLLYPTVEGTLTITAQLNGAAITVLPAAGVSISERFGLTCLKMSTVLSSYTIMNQHAMGRADTTVYGNTATSAAYVDGSGMCEAWRL